MTPISCVCVLVVFPGPSQLFLGQRAFHIQPYQISANLWICLQRINYFCTCCLWPPNGRSYTQECPCCLAFGPLFLVVPLGLGSLILPKDSSGCRLPSGLWFLARASKRNLASVQVFKCRRLSKN